MTYHYYYDPFHGDFDRLFEEAFNARINNGQVTGAPVSLQNPSRPTVNRPRMNVFEHPDNSEDKDQNIVISIELPGFKESDIDIQVYDSNRVTVTAMTDPTEDADLRDCYAVREIPYGKFVRSFQLPRHIRAQWVDAKLEDGILKITFPRFIAELVQPERIPITNQPSQAEHSGSGPRQ